MRVGPILAGMTVLVTAIGAQAQIRGTTVVNESKAAAEQRMLASYLPKPPLTIAVSTGEIPTDQAVYAFLQRLELRKWYRDAEYNDWTGSIRGHSRAEFAEIIAQELRGMDGTFEQEIQADTTLWYALSYLVQEFTPELRQQKVDVVAVMKRLVRSGRHLQHRQRTFPFYDVPPTHWAESSVERLRFQGILIGYPNGSFGK